MEDRSSRFSAPEPGPGDEFYATRSEQMEKPLLMTHPNVPCTVVGEGIDDSVRYGCYGNKPVGLEKGNPALRPDPHLPASVLKEGMRLVRQPAVCNLSNRAPRVGLPSWGESADLGATAHARPASIAINRDLAFHPSIQPIRCAHPKTAIPRGQNGRNPSARPTLVDGNRGDGEVAKPIEAIIGRHPDIAFPIFKESVNGFARQAFGWGKQISSSLVDMKKTLVHQGGVQQTAIAIPK